MKTNPITLGVLILSGMVTGNALAITDALKINIAQGSNSDEAVIRFLNGATGTYDGSYDAYKLFSSNTAVPNIFTKTADGYDLSINALPAFASSQSVDVYLRINSAGTYTITATEPGLFAPTACITMQDLSNGALYYLRTTTPYIITLPVISQTGPARFRVFFSYPAEIQTTDATCASCTNGQVTFNKPGESNWEYTVFNSSLAAVASGSSSSPVTVASLASGNYSITFNNNYTCAETRSFFVGPVTYYSRTSGNWEDASTWSTTACGGAAASTAPSSGSNVVICSGNTVTINTMQNLSELNISGSVMLNANASISGNIINNGTFSTGTYTVTLNGSSAQNISGSGSMVFAALVINNSTPSSAVTLQAPVTVNGVFKLQDGHLLSSSSNALTLGASASVVLGAAVQDSSFVKGPMKHTVNVSSGVTKVFPVGKDNSFRRIDLTVDQKNNTTTTYTAELINNSAMALGYSLPSTLSNVSDVRYHQITQSPSSTRIDQAEVRIYFNCQGGDDVVQSLGAMSVANDNGSGSWTDLSDTPSGYSCTGSSYWGNALSGTFTSFAGTKFALANTGTPVALPVSVTQFSAAVKEKTVGINWTTASEAGCDHFVVERSMDGETFSPLEIIKGSGNSSTVKNYTWIDELPLPGTSFYRLRQVDYNGTSWNSDAASVYMKINELITIFPNPVVTDCYLLIKGSKEEEARLTVYDLNGKECFNESFRPVSDSEVVRINLINRNLINGVYIFSLETKNSTSHQKIIITKG